VLGLAGAPERTDDGSGTARQTAKRRDGPGFVEKIGRISVVGVPPAKQIPRPVDRQPHKREPGRAQLRLIAKFPRRPLRREPHAADGDGEHDGNLADEEFGWGHAWPPDESGVARETKKENHLYLRRASLS
jgi:hypothetical protein